MRSELKDVMFDLYEQAPLDQLNESINFFPVVVIFYWLSLVPIRYKGLDIEVRIRNLKGVFSKVPNFKVVYQTVLKPLCAVLFDKSSRWLMLVTI